MQFAFGPFTLIASLLIPVVALIFVAVVIWLVFRAAAHRRELLSKERLAALEHGVPLPPATFLEGLRHRPRSSLKTTAGVLGAGAGMTVALLICCPESRLWGWGVGLIVVGLVHLAYWSIRGRREWEEARAREAELARTLATGTGDARGEELGEPR